MPTVEVAVGVVIRNQSVFVTKRAANVHQGDKWEFPGGKVELNESPEHALVRELQEEIAIQVHVSEPLTVVEHDYGDKRVKLLVFVVKEFSGKPQGNEGQSFQWVDYQFLSDLNFPEANKPIIEAVNQYLNLNAKK